VNTWQQKSLKTALVLLLGYFVFVLVHDLTTQPWEGLNKQEQEAIEDGNFWSDFIAIALFAASSLWWHISDIWSQPGHKSKLVSITLDYRTFLAVLIVGLVGTALVFSGWSGNFYCRNAGPIPSTNPDTKFFMICDPPLAYGIEFLTLLPILVLIVLAFSKTIAAALNKIASSK
jgi:hypothetical protein